VNKGYIHIYTGNGKGKTTAAFGLALRASGAGLKVYIGQFIKGKVYHEIKALNKNFPNITIRQFGLGCFILKDPTKEDKEAAQSGFEKIKIIIEGSKYDLVIMDEVNIALYFQLIDLQDLIEVIRNKPAPVELVLTGRYAPDELIACADLVTEMKEIKHYYQNGIEARKGIEY
jgi:cob(I)alamin adenosyltransferase